MYVSNQDRSTSGIQLKAHRRYGRRTALCVAVSSILSSGVTGVQAQDSSAVALEEVVVTARRVEESIQDVPISMTVYTQKQISDLNVTVATDLATYTPSLSVNERYGPEKASFSIRGFNQDQSTAPTVGVYFADVVGVRAQGGTTSGNTVGAGAFMDLQNVQILKGPQGTLFGRNTDGGAILLVPNRPSETFGGYVEGSIGNYDMHRGLGVLNVPITDNFRMRFAADINQRDGYMENQSGVGPDAYNDRNYDAYRVAAVWDITPDIQNYTIFHNSDSDTAGYGARYIGCDRSAVPDETGAIDFRGFAAMAACDQVDRHRARGDGKLTVDIGADEASVHIKQWQIINTTTWDVNDSLTVKNIFSYGEFEERSRFSLYSDNLTIPDSVNFIDFGFPAPVVSGSPFQLIELAYQPGEANSQQKTWTEELQLQGDYDDLSFVVGGYLEFSEPMGFNGGVTSIFASCDDIPSYDCDFSTVPLASNVSQSTTQFDFENHGIFAQGTYSFTDEFALTLGARYTFDKIEGYDESVRVAPAPFTTEPLITTCRDAFRFSDVVVSDPSDCGKTLDQESNEPTWLVNFDYTPNSDTLIYAKYARGYRQGGINFTNPGLELWDPESVDNYEVGAKLSFFGSVPGFFNIAAFYNDYTDQQLFGTLIADRVNYPNVSGGAAIVNAGESEISGVEIESVFLLFERLNISASYTYLDTEVKDLDVSGISLEGTPFLELTPRAVEGGPLNLTPENKLLLSATYEVPMDENHGIITAGVTYTYVDEQVIDEFSPPEVGIADERNLVNLNFAWDRVMGSPIDLSVFGTNVTNEEYIVATGGGYGSFGIADAMYGEPRMYGMRIRYNFGDI